MAADSDSGRQPSDNEKEVSEKGVVHDSNEQLPEDPDAHLSEEERAAIDRKLVWKLDMKIIPWLTLLYLLAFLDRTNIGNAKIDGLITDLKMSSGAYNAALSIFFVSYSLIEPATNVLLKRLRPSVFLPVTMILWGIVMTTMGLVHNFSGLAATRWFLGLTEAGLFPGVTYYLSCWYKRSEFGIRAAIFFSAAAVAGSFGGLLAAAIAQMKGIGGKPGWAWIFILEGLATVLIGLISPWFVHDFPDDAKFLTPEDRARVIRRLKLDNQASAEKEDFKMDYFWAAFKDLKTWAFALVYTGADGALYGFALFLPTIINELGFTSTKANLLSVPPYAVAAVLTIAVGWFADRTKLRGWCNICVSVFGIVGFSMLLGSNLAGVKYAGTFLAAMGIYPLIPNTITWASNNIEGVYKRGVALGFIIGFGNLNGVMSSNVYIASQAPNFPTGHGVVLGYLVILLFCGSIITHFWLMWENKQRLAGKRDHWVEGKTAAEIHDLGDKRPDFIYVT